VYVRSAAHGTGAAHTVPDVIGKGACYIAADALKPMLSVVPRQAVIVYVSAANNARDDVDIRVAVDMIIRETVDILVVGIFYNVIRPLV
jgi:hypothetical protein